MSSKEVIVVINDLFHVINKMSIVIGDMNHVMNEHVYVTLVVLQATVRPLPRNHGHRESRPSP
jgi:hypothetical protein